MQGIESDDRKKCLKSDSHRRCAGNQNACGVQDGSGRGAYQGSGVGIGGVESEIGWGGEKGQRLKLAEHAVVQTRSGTHDVAVVHMVQAVLAVGRGSVLAVVCSTEKSIIGRNTDNSSQA